MPRSRRVVEACNHHEFALYPPHAQHLSASYCTDNEPSRRRCRSEKPKKCFDGPTFNPDHNYGSPAFILPSENEYYLRRGDSLKTEHCLKFRHFTDQKSQMNVPKPRTRNNYCSVCKMNYEDYLSHIETTFHKRKIRSCLFNTFILELAQKFEGAPEGHTAMRKNESTIVEVSDDDEVEIISNPTKKQKTEEPPLSYAPGSLRTIPSTNLGLSSQMRQAQAKQKQQQQQLSLNICMNMNLINFSNYPPLYPPPPAYFPPPPYHLHPYCYYTPAQPMPAAAPRKSSPEVIVIDD